MGKQKEAQNKKRQQAGEMLDLLVHSFQKPKSWWNRLNAWKLSKIRTDLSQAFTEADQSVRELVKTEKTPRPIPMTEEEDEE